jgi:hypothetical protein
MVLPQYGAILQEQKDGIFATQSNLSKKIFKLSIARVISAADTEDSKPKQNLELHANLGVHNHLKNTKITLQIQVKVQD